MYTVYIFIFWAASIFDVLMCRHKEMRKIESTFVVVVVGCYNEKMTTFYGVFRILRIVL